MIYQPTQAYRKISAASRTAKNIVVQGGQGASKTVSITMLLANQCYNTKPVEISILGHELTKLKQTVVKDFQKILKSWNRWDEARWTRGAYYQFPNDSFIEFIGLDRTDIGKGLRRDFLYFNEGNRGIAFETYHQAASRTRYKNFIDFNPDYDFWAHTEVMTRDDSTSLILTYQDNEYLPEAELKEILGYKTKGFNSDGTIKNHYWANKWRVYGLGQVGKIEGLVFPDCKIIDEDFIPEVYGLDFGFSHDPTALVGLKQSGGELLGKQLIYDKALTNLDISNRMEALGISKNIPIIADSAEPKSIKELEDRGWYVIGAKKGPDSIDYGIQLINQYGMSITRKSLDWIKESNNYRYVMKGSETTNKPIDKFNHCWDAARYGATYLLTAPPIPDDNFITVTI